MHIGFLKTKFISLLFLQFMLFSGYGLNVRIINSQAIFSFHDQDVIWKSVVQGMGHTANISPQTILDNNSFFANTDVLIIPSSIVTYSTTRINTILQFI